MNSAISLSKGWWIFAKALLQSKPWSVSCAAEWMFRFNVTARNLRRHPITDQIYELKNILIKYLYQHGYCVEVKLHTQKRMCYSCEGTGEYWNGEDCWKCNGTGVYSTTQLYAFRFDVASRRYAWHQLRKLVDYPIVLTEAEPSPFVQPTPKEELSLKLDEAWLGCAIVYWFLLFHRERASLLLFIATRNRIRITLWSIRDWGRGVMRRLSVKRPNATPQSDEELEEAYEMYIEREYGADAHEYEQVSVSEDDIPF